MGTWVPCRERSLVLLWWPRWVGWSREGRYKREGMYAYTWLICFTEQQKQDNVEKQRYPNFKMVRVDRHQYMLCSPFFLPSLLSFYKQLLGKENRPWKACGTATQWQWTLNSLPSLLSLGGGAGAQWGSMLFCVSFVITALPLIRWCQSLRRNAKFHHDFQGSQRLSDDFCLLKVMNVKCWCLKLKKFSIPFIVSSMIELMLIYFWDAL